MLRRCNTADDRRVARPGRCVGVRFLRSRIPSGGQTAAVQVEILSVASALCALLLLVAARTAKTWVRILAEAGSLASAAAVSVALLSADPALLVPALAVAALQAAAVGSALRVVWVQMLAPVLACSSWLTFAAEALTGNAQLITVPDRPGHPGHRRPLAP